LNRPDPLANDSTFQRFNGLTLRRSNDSPFSSLTARPKLLAFLHAFSMGRDNLLIVADSGHDANMLYAVRMFVPDPFIFLRLNGKCHIVLSDLEIDRSRKEAPHCRAISLSRCVKTLQDSGVGKPAFAHIIRLLLRRQRLRKVCVPYNFPAGLLHELRKLRVSVQIRKGMFFAERQTKSAEEVKKISAALMMAEVGLAEGLYALKNAKIGRKRKLLYRNVPLTAEKLRAIIDTAIVQAGGLVSHTIVACGVQGCDPHERGYGPLRANEAIILDVFPRSQRTGYFGDITRTVVKGRASEELRKLYHTVERGQELAFDELRKNTRGRDVHQRVADFFEREGYKTGKRGGHMQGFFHGTGHGVGLELHETPRVSKTSTDILRRGHVVTVEPGLYYPNIGGVRLEDVALITENGARNLTKFEKVLEV
jgi:Xaa-Pro aminopeptidase